MEFPQAIAALRKYHEQLILLGIKPCECSHEKDAPEPSKALLSHALWMVTQTLGFFEKGEYERAFRWFGFIQCVLWTQGLYTIEEMRTHEGGRAAQVLGSLYQVKPDNVESSAKTLLEASTARGFLRL